MKYRNKNVLWVGVLFLLVMGLADISQAVITGSNLQLTDEANTVASDGSGDDWADTSGANPKWDDRSANVSGAACVSAVDPVHGAINRVYEAREGDYELKTTLSGLTPGKVYQVWIINSVRNPDSPDTRQFGIAGAFDGDPLVDYMHKEEGGGVLQEYTGLVSHPGNDDDWLVFEANLGTTPADENGEIKVLVAHAGQERSLYHGLAYTPTGNESAWAWNPDPANEKNDVDVNVSFKWHTGWDNGAVNPDIISHRFFLSDPNDSILPEGSYIEIPAGIPVNLTAEYNPLRDLEVDSLYVWRVDEILSTGETITGSVWSFRTIKPVCQTPPRTDMSGPNGVPDCIINIYDLVFFYDQWLNENF